MPQPSEQDAVLNVRIPIEMKLWLREISAQTPDRNMSDFVREAIRSFMDITAIVQRV